MSNHPLRVALVVMPVVDGNMPSIGLTQLQSVLKRELGDRVEVEIHYLNHDFARFMGQRRGPGGANLHKVLLDNQHLGLPEWIFRQLAFPELPDNTDAYFRRFFPGRSPAVQGLRRALLERNRGLGALFDECIERTELDRADVVGFTSMFTQNVATFAMARMLKERAPGITVVMGGANCETPMGEEIAEQVEAIDWVFSGPGLVSFPRFIRHLLKGETDACARIPGVLCADNARSPSGARVGEELPIDTEVELDYSAFFASLEHDRPEGLDDLRVPIETSRGCWWGERSHCSFCGLNGDSMAYRAMAPDLAVKLFHSLFERYADLGTCWFSVDNILPTNYVEEVLPRLETPPGTHIFYEVKADLTPEALRIMAKAGVTEIQPGIEALSTTALKLMKKGTTAFINLRLLKNCRRYGITPKWNLLVGSPGEPEEVYESYVENMPRLTHLCPPQGTAAVRFDRFSPYFMRPEEYGLKLRCLDFYPEIYPFDEDSLARFAYYFRDESYDAPYVQAIAKWLDRLRESVGMWRARWDAGEPPRLALERDREAARVRDTRGGDELVHDLSPGAVRLLEHLERQRRPAELERFGAQHGFDALAELSALDERGLVFRERDSYMSLVLPDGEEIGL